MSRSPSTRQRASPRPSPELRRSAKRAIDRLSGRPLELAAEFLTYISEYQLDAETRELLEIPGFAQSAARGIKDARAGRVKDWRRVRDDV